MGEYADDLIEAGIMQPYPFGHPKRTHNTPQKPSEAPKTALKDFEVWYKGINIEGCSKYEIASMAWHESAEQLQKQADDDEFTWWFDGLPEVYHVLKAKFIAKIAWEESLKRLDNPNLI